MHAAIEFALAYPSDVPETLAFLAAPDELALCWLLAGAERAGVTAVSFREPDLGGELTAVALEPGGRKLARMFPLALTGYREGVKT